LHTAPTATGTWSSPAISLIGIAGTFGVRLADLMTVNHLTVNSLMALRVGVGKRRS
jgi:hypothetical protein